MNTCASSQSANESPARVKSFTGKDDLTCDADMCIICNDDERLYVHRLILSKWSSVFRECPGATKNAESEGGMLEFAVEESSADWTEILGVIYPITPVTDINWENAARIFALADKYGMQGVMERCHAFLLSPRTVFSTLRVKNDYVLKWLAFAAQYQQTALADKCMQFIRQNYRNSRRSIEELRFSPEKCYLRDVLAMTPEGVRYIIDILHFVMQQKR